MELSPTLWSTQYVTYPFVTRKKGRIDVSSCFSCAAAFTAPVRGVYYFRFTVKEDSDNVYYGARLLKNGKSIMLSIEWNDHLGHSYLANGLTVELEEGDVVHVNLTEGYVLYDSVNNHGFFSEFLLFPM